MFCPQKSLIRQRFHKERFADMTLYGFPELDWSPCIRMLEGHGRFCQYLQFIENDQKLVTRLDNVIKIWDVITGECWTRLENARHGYTLSAVSTNGKMALLKFPDGMIEVWDLHESTLLRTLDGHGDIVQALVLLADGRTAISVGSGGAVKRWDLHNGTCIIIQLQDWGQDLPAGFEYSGVEYRLSPDGQALVTQVKNIVRTKQLIVGEASHAMRQTRLDEIRIYNTFSGNRVNTFNGSEDRQAVTFSDDGQKVALTSENDRIEIWDVATFQVLTSITTSGIRVGEVAFSQDGRSIAWAEEEGIITSWDVQTSMRLQSFESHDINERIVFSRDGKSLASVSVDNVIRIWDLESNLQPQPGTHHRKGPSRLIVSPDNSRVATRAYDGSIQIWDIKTKQHLKTLYSLPSREVDLELSIDSSLLLVTSSLGGLISILDTSQDRCILELGVLSGYIGFVGKTIFSPDGQKILIALPIGDIRVYDIRSGTILQTLSRHQSIIVNILTSADGKKIASVSTDGHIVIWDVSLLMTTPITEFWTGAGISRHLLLLFSVNGQYLAAFQQYGGILTVWDCETGLCKSRINNYGNLLLTSGMFADNGQIGDCRRKSGENNSPQYLTCSTDCRWIVRDGLPVVWLPPIYRMVQTCVAVTETTVAIATTSGHVLFFEFDRF